MQSSKIKDENPLLYVVFIKNMSTLDYILGDPVERNQQKKEEYLKAKDAKA